MDSFNSGAAPAAAKVYEETEIREPFPLPEPLGIEVLALNALVVDLAQAIAAIAPGLLDKSLSVARIRLQLLDNGAAEVVAGEAMVQRQKITMLERALGRTPTQGV